VWLHRVLHLNGTCSLDSLKPEGVRGVVRRVENRKSLALKVPRKCPLCHSGKLGGKAGKALGRDEGKALVDGLIDYEYTDKVEHRAPCVPSGF
jgi:hypothetical protein